MIVMRRMLFELLVGIPVIIGVYTLLEFLYCKFIVYSPFVFDIRACLICLIVWFVCTTVSYMARKNISKNTHR